jgi:hypothetical protein
VTPEGRPALVDFQLAMTLTRRGALARSLGHDDLRHLLKHKRSYLPERLTAREKRILARQSLVSRIWMATGKKVYLFVTRKILRWRDREGAGDRSPEIAMRRQNRRDIRSSTAMPPPITTRQRHSVTQADDSVSVKTA